jgi:hypothetical protein
MSVSQPTLFTFAEPTYKKHWTIDERYAAFIGANPWLLPELARRARAFRDAGYRCSAKGLIEGLRSEWILTRGEKPNLNNSMTSRLARDLVAQYPDLDGVFQFRALKESA